MQSVVRSSFVGLLALASLTACGDKVTPVTITTSPPPSVVHSVTVTPNSVPNLAIGTSVVLSASVDADAGVTDRTVTWASSDATIASVDATGKVTGVKAGQVTISAAAKADPSVKGAALVSVGAVAAAPVVLIQSINKTICVAGAGCNSVPVDVTNASGQLDVILNVDTNGQALKSVSATLKCGADSMTQGQGITANVAALDANEAAAPVTISFNTADFTIANGVATVKLHNNPQCTLSASATTATSQGASNTTVLTLNNLDAVVVTNSFTAITNAEGVTQPTSANDSFGLPWKSGSVAVLAVPVLYSNRVLATITITLPGAGVVTPSQPISAAPYVATWAGSGTTGPRVTGLTLTATCNTAAPQPNGCEANNNTPLGITPQIVALDNNGNDLGLVVLNNTIATGGAAFRLDNTPPEAPLAFNTPGRQSGWVNAAYVFTGVGVGTSNGNLGGNGSTSGQENYVSCGDGPSPAPASPGGTFACVAQVGVSASTHGAVGVGTASSNGNTKFTYYAIPAGSFVAASTTNGTSTSATSCSTTGWTKITTAGDLAPTTVATAYVVRVFEADLLGNSRCTDLVTPPAAAANLGTEINTGISTPPNYTAFAAQFGVDKVAPTDSLLTPANPACGVAPNTCAGDLGKYTTNPVPFFTNSYNDPDGASGFSASPLTTKLVRLAIDPATPGVASTVNTAFGCPIGFSNGACGTAAAGGSIAADAGGSNGVSSGVDGYYTYTATIMDRARNVGNTVTRQVVVDRILPVMGGVAVPSILTGGQTASFATSASDNLDLVNTSYLLSYAVTPSGSAFPLNIRAAGADIGVAFDNTLTIQSSFTLAVPSFVRSASVTTAGGLPPNSTGTLAGSITVNVVDAAGNTSLPVVQAINPVAISTTNPLTNFATLVNGQTFSGTGFSVTNAATTISNCLATGCTGNAAPTQPTAVVLTATAQGTENAATQFANPFSSVSWYYLSATNEWQLIGSSTTPGVSDNVAQTQRTYSWTLQTPFDPPANLTVPGTLKIIAVGTNLFGDALVTAVNANINMVNP